MAEIKTNAIEVAREISDFSKQTPFAIARALTWTAKDAQERIKQELPFRFTLRNNWVRSGIRIKPAKKTQRIPTAVVGTPDWFMREQELGAIRRPKKSKLLAVPMRGVRRTKRGTITKANKPRALLRKPKHFINTKNGTPILWRRRFKYKRYPIIPLWRFVPKAKIDERWRLRESVGFVIDKRLDRNMRRSLRKALENAK